MIWLVVGLFGRIPYLVHALGYSRKYTIYLGTIAVGIDFDFGIRPVLVTVVDNKSNNFVELRVKGWLSAYESKPVVPGFRFDAIFKKASYLGDRHSVAAWHLPLAQGPVAIVTLKIAEVGYVYFYIYPTATVHQPAAPSPELRQPP